MVVEIIIGRRESGNMIGGVVPTRVVERYCVHSIFVNQQKSLTEIVNGVIDRSIHFELSTPNNHINLGKEKVVIIGSGILLSTDITVDEVKKYAHYLVVIENGECSREIDISRD